MQELRHRFHEDLAALEAQALDGLDLVIQQLDRSLESISYQDVELAGMVVADDDRIDGRYLEVHQGILSLLARQSPVAGDLRIVAALLHVIRCVERMGDQCVNIAKLVPLSGYEAPKDKDISTRSSAWAAWRARRSPRPSRRSPDATPSLPRTWSARTPRSTASTARSFAAPSRWGMTSTCARGAMFMILVARCLERIGDNTVDIAEQTVFVVTGLFREFTDASQPS